MLIFDLFCFFHMLQMRLGLFFANGKGVGDSPSSKTNGEGTLGSSFTLPILQRKQMGKEHWAVPSPNLSICENQHS
jgi:hypothetical protein